MRQHTVTCDFDNEEVADFDRLRLSGGASSWATTPERKHLCPKCRKLAEELSRRLKVPLTLLDGVR